jgi:serine protease
MTRTFGTLAVIAGLFVGTMTLRPAALGGSDPTPPTITVPSLGGGGRLVVDLVDGATEADLVGVERLLGADLDWVHPLAIDEALAVGSVEDLEVGVAALRGDPRVEVVEPEILLEAFEWPAIASRMASADYPNDPLYEKQWHLRAMGAPAGWADSPRGKGIVVAVVDTGIAPVEDLAGTKLLAGATFVPGTRSAVDDQGHGTHVAGTIAQTTNNATGTAGVAPEATLLPVKVLSSIGLGSSAWIAAGIDYAVDEGADVINLSLGGGYSSVIHNAIKKAEKQGVVVVAAAGNSGRRGVSWPGALKETIGVSATGPDGTLAPYSSYGEGVDIAAPGGDKRKPGGGVLQDTIDGKGGHHYAELQGTSMATPHVAGAAAVLLSTGLPPDAVRRALLDSARSQGEGWNERYGYGNLDLGAALSRGAGATVDATRFALGAVFALLVGQLAATRQRFRFASGLVAGLTAGGLFVVPLLPIGGGELLHLLGSPVLEWPAVVVSPWWVQFPLWLSALLPAFVAFTLGAFTPSRWLATGLACGIGAHLLHGAATGTLAPWFLPHTFGTVWLLGNAATCILLALVLGRVQRLSEGAR